MRWTPGGDNSDIEDRRGQSGGGGGFNIGGFGGMHLGIGGTLVVLALSMLFHTNLFSIFGGGGAPTASTRPVADVNDPAEAKQKDFVTAIVNDVQHTWDQTLPQQGGTQYRHAKLVLFRDLTDSGCGTAQSATGPFYCPEDEKVYLDLGFFQELRARFGAPGEFAQAYVIAHEVGHHVQKILGTESKVHRLQRGDPSQANPL